MAYGRYHHSGKHKYVIQIVKNTGLVGIGVGSKKSLKGANYMNAATGYSVYTSTGHWYGHKKKANVCCQSSKLNTNDKIEVYFDVDTEKVRYYRGSQLLASCKTNRGKEEIEKGLRLAIALRAAEVAIVDYEAIDSLPNGKMKQKKFK
eukprot:TRINITY_DN1416_c0_g1_i1.p1 TRINITY_DN1416_c0_g1~~TRINITY_DN1416_c0_g1_i1.p1  ORF type:complete len:148 (+),score=35.48 TRINITY_DN1416_c0_g1_i1:434-877(+)